MACHPPNLPTRPAPVTPQRGVLYGPNKEVPLCRDGGPLWRDGGAIATYHATRPTPGLGISLPKCQPSRHKGTPLSGMMVPFVA